MWWLLTQHFGLRGRQELHDMKVDDFQLCKDDKYVEFLQFTEGQTKTRQGGLRTKHRDFQPRTFAVGGERCPVALFKQFQIFSKPEDDWYFTSPSKRSGSCNFSFLKNSLVQINSKFNL